MSRKSAVKKRAPRPAAKRPSGGRPGKPAKRRHAAAGASASRGAKPRSGKGSVAPKPAARKQKPAARRAAHSGRAVSAPPPISPPRTPVVTPAAARKAIEPVRPPVPDRPVFHEGAPAAPPRKSDTPRIAPPPRRSRAGLSEEDLLRAPVSRYMNAEQLAFFRERLLDMQRELLEKADLTSEHLRAHEIEPDPTDQATIEEEYALELRTRDRERKLLKKIDEALKRIEDGSYGYCEETGEPIGLPRLLARPTATLSVEAQTRRELKQKLYGD